MNIKNKKRIAIVMLVVFSFMLAAGLSGAPDKKPDSPKCEKFDENLEGLVERGVITTEELTKIRDYFKIEREEKRKVFDEIKDMDEAQRKEYMQNYRKNKINVVDKMVQDKVITKEQAESIKEIMPKHKHKRKEG